MSIVWIGVFSFIMVDFAQHMGRVIGIPIFVMGGSPLTDEVFGYALM